VKKTKGMNNSKIKRIFKVIRKRVKIKTLIFLILILVLNTCAWYIYISEVSSDISTHVKAWKIEFNNNISQDVNFIVEDIYPGMETVTKEIELINKGELRAVISCDIIEMRILEDEYVVDDENITSQQLVEDISKNYPFSVKFYIDGEECHSKVVEADGSCMITIEISWPFDSGDDEADTYWGNKAYDFIQEHEDEACIKIKAKIKASQDE